MKHIQTIALCLVTAIALSAAATGNASAELWPLFVPASGHFPVPYHGLLSSQIELATAGGSELACKSIHYSGSLLNPHLADTRYLFLGCGTEILGSAVACTGEDLAPEQILLEADEHLGLIDDPAGNLFNHVGSLVLLPAGFHATCGAGIAKAEVKLSGSVISQSLSPVNQQRHEFEFLFKPIKHGEPLWSLFLSPLIGTVHALLLTTIGSGSAEASSLEGGPGTVLLLPAGETAEIKL